MSALIDYFSQHPALALAVVFAAALLESMAVVGTVVPGSSVVVAAGILVGLGALDPWVAAAVAIVGAVLGDGFSFWVGHHYHDALRSRWPLKAHPELLTRGQAYFASHGSMSVFWGRFLGPVRAIVPVVAGMSDMPLLRFTLVNVLSAVAWSGVHLLPGALFGASLQLAGAVSSRLLTLLALGVGLVWLCAVLVRLGHRIAWPIARRQCSRMVNWAHGKSGVLPRVALTLLDPARPASSGIFIAGLMLLGGFWLFLGTLQDVMSSDPLVQLDHAVFTALQQLRTGWVDNLMIGATELGSATVAMAVIASVSAVLMFKRCWRTLAYWLGAAVFTQALVWVLKVTLARERPVAMYAGMDSFSFPSGHVATSAVLYGFLAFLVARQQSPRIKWAVTVLVMALVGAIAISRLYLGAHWLSDVLASLGLGMAWVALLSIACTQQLGDRRLPARAVSVAALGAQIVAGAAVITAHRAGDAARYAVRAAAAPTLLVDWPVHGWQRLPSRRSEVDGDHEEPLSIQWVGSADHVARVLAAMGWRSPPPWTMQTALLWLLPSADAGQLPVLAKLHGGQSPAMTFEKVIDSAHREVIRLWRTPYQVSASGDAQAPLWIATLTLERVAHPAGAGTLALTDPFAASLTTPLAKMLQAQGERVDIRLSEAAAVLLVR